MTELLSNVHRHARPDKSCTVELELLPERLTVSVRDHDPRLPVPAEGADAADATPLATCGRGLAMVAAMSESWGARPDGENGKVVWFTLSAPTAVGPQPARTPRRMPERQLTARPADVRPTPPTAPVPAGAPAPAGAGAGGGAAVPAGTRTRAATVPAGATAVPARAQVPGAAPVGAGVPVGSRASAAPGTPAVTAPVGPADPVPGAPPVSVSVSGATRSAAVAVPASAASGAQAPARSAVRG